MNKSIIGQRNWDIVNDFKGYRNREDPTNLLPGTMVFPSHDVLTNLSDRIAPREGYKLFGQSYTDINGVLGSFDLLDVPTTITERHLKSFGTHIQVLWEGFDETSPAVWNDIYNSSTSSYWNFTQFWESDIQKLWTLGANGGDSLFAWNNALAGFLSSTSNTLTKQGSTTWEEEGFDPYANYTTSIVFTAASITPGVILSLNSAPSTAGDGYTSGDVLNITGGGGSGGQAIVAQISPTTITLTYNPASLVGTFVIGESVFGNESGNAGVIQSQGVGFLVIVGFETFQWFGGETITGLTSGATMTLGAYTVFGSIISLVLSNGGSGYSTGINIATSGGSGTGATVNIQAVETIVVDATMSDLTNSFLAENFQLGQTIVITGTTSNNGTYIIAGITPSTITIANGQNFTSETDSSTTIISTPSIVVNGTTYTYTGGLSTITLTGVNAPVVGVIGDMVAQKVNIYPLSYFYGFALLTTNCLTVDASQLYIGSADSSVGYISNIDNFFDYRFALTGRLAGTGGQFNCDAPFKALANLDGTIFSGNGQNEWNEITFSNGQVTFGNFVIQVQNIDVAKIKTTTLQGTISQAGLTSIENNLAFLSFSKQSLILGKTQFQDGQQTSFYTNNVTTQLSAPVFYDFENLDFTDASIFYDDSNKYILHSFPRSGVVMIYNINADQAYWESPQNLTIGRFSIIHGELYGHGYLTPETYEMFTGHNDNGGAIACLGVFAFQNFGFRVNLKHDMGHFIEGYISSNTKLLYGWNFEQSGCGSSVNSSILGTDGQFVCLGSDHNWLGSGELGMSGLGSVNLPKSGQDLPPAFQIIDTLGTPIDFRLAQFFIGSNGVDQNWQMVSYGMEVTVSDKINVGITR